MFKIIVFCYKHNAAQFITCLTQFPMYTVEVLYTCVVPRTLAAYYLMQT